MFISGWENCKEAEKLPSETRNISIGNLFLIKFCWFNVWSIKELFIICEHVVNVKHLSCGDFGEKYFGIWKQHHPQ